MTREEAINLVKQVLPCLNIDEKIREGFVTLIPELKESEDERIRKELIEYLTHRSEVTGFIDEDKDCKRWIAYLEKQKEQKPIFKKGDKVIWDDEEFNILDVNETEYNVGGYRVPFSRQNELHPIWQKSAEWSEEDERTLESFLGWLQGSMGEKTYSSWLKSLPERFRPQPKQEWSEEDEEMLNSCISSIEEAKENRYAYKETDGDTSYDHEIAWLKSLRNRVGKEFLQPHWKPSEEQMEALKDAFSKDGCNEYRKVINSLYCDLQKLL